MKRDLLHSNATTMNTGSEIFFETSSPVAEKHPSRIQAQGKEYIALDAVEKLLTNMNVSRLDAILYKGVIRVGTTGDYKPFTYYNPETEEYEGFDIDVAHLLANELGVEVQFVHTTWPTMMRDFGDDQFDIAMGGVSRNLERQKKAHLSQPYFKDGKAPLIRKEDKHKYKSLADVDHTSVTIGLNPGGTNEKFVRENIKHAKVVMIDHNLDIPYMVADGVVDVMITDHIEAVYYSNLDERLYAALREDKFTKSEKVYLIHRGDLDYQNWIALWLEQMKDQGELNELKQKWGLFFSEDSVPS